ncbi:hypothetical protein GCM10009665_33290 [Kitasatospora nipponensis]|uniref:Uncharacterized protein n=1 Tax=Kitasatospora nipponensis TaxID=258049 RepID=A0ABN1W832_9ACTN
MSEEQQELLAALGIAKDYVLAKEAAAKAERTAGPEPALNSHSAIKSCPQGGSWPEPEQWPAVGFRVSSRDFGRVGRIPRGT